MPHRSILESHTDIEQCNPSMGLIKKRVDVCTYVKPRVHHIKKQTSMSEVFQKNFFAH